MNSPILHFISPPVPYFIDCGRAYYRRGESHISRSNIGSFDLIVVTKGTLFIGEGTNEWALQKGEAFILRPDANHYGTAPCVEETEIIWIHFHTFGAWNECEGMNACLENQSALIEQHKQTAYLNHAEVCPIFIPKYMQLSQKAIDILEQFFQLEHEPRSLRNWKRQTAFQLFMQHLDRDLAAASDATAFHLAEKVELFIRQNYTQRVSNPLLQKELNYHPNYLAKCMLKVYGMTPIDYLQHYRIEQAKKLLIQTEWSITRIAEEIGFQHGSYFSTCFLKKEGISPLSFRRKFIGNA
ncbi:AraC family transcriptional regulator [Paenibacillus radicis (ex Xue et al. 2023)]|uniref:AraC family transcriptional regulator n=1 Tax=Paenibacillus radicis (ex Xue et al. 2023) TaxID=2972489 RepID=A0ABT1YID0_9BACL|nr:AraC family transcriptional regulator [Paenibacillus radicis (ex Xue et al. 2023)]MCR8632934.1 AraC family transcriptional regulator [Paenibacillus radicis (ex Xue et al. 2023)]